MLRALARGRTLRRYSTAPELLKQIDRALVENQGAQAADLIEKYGSYGKFLPAKSFGRFFDICKAENDPVINHLFFQLTPVGGNRTALNFGRVIQLYITSGDIESAVAFIRDIQLANGGTVRLGYETLESLVLAAKWQNDVEIAWESILMIQELHTDVYSRTWGLFLSLVLDVGHYKALAWFIKHVAVPGYIVMDDHSYWKASRVAACHGDFMLCRWCLIRMRRRQRALNVQDKDLSSSTILDMYLCLIEAGAMGDSPQQGSIKSSCRYLIHLNDAAASVRTASLPRLVGAMSDPATAEYVADIYDVMSKDSHANEAVRTLLFNVLLAGHLAARRTVPALALYEQSVEASLDFNEDSLVLLLTLSKMVKNAGLIESVLDLATLPVSKRVLEAAYLASINNGHGTLVESLKKELETAGISKWND